MNFFKKNKVNGILVKTEIELYKEESFIHFKEIMCVGVYEMPTRSLSIYKYKELDKDFSEYLFYLLEKDALKSEYLYVYKLIKEDKSVYIIPYNFYINRNNFYTKKQKIGFDNAIWEINRINREEQLKKLLD